MDLKKRLTSNLKAIVLTGLIFAICLGAYKFFFTPLTTISGDFIYNRIIRIEEKGVASISANKFNYPALFKTSNVLLKFIADTEDKLFDYKKVNSSWARLSEANKVKWLTQRIWMQNFSENVLEIVFTIPAANISDLSYLQKNTEPLFDIFVMNASDMIREIKPNANVKTVKSAVIVPDVIRNDKNKIAMRYALYGFIAGVLLSVATIIGISLFKEIQD